MNQESNIKSKHQKTTFLTHEELQNLSQDPKNKIYNYQYDEAKHRFTAPQRRVLIDEIRTSYVNLYSTNSDKNDNELREILYQKNKNFKHFAEDHARIFTILTNRESSNDYINHIRYMAYLKCEEESGNTTQSETQVKLQEYLLDKFKTGESLDAYKKRLSKEETEKMKARAKCKHHKHQAVDMSLNKSLKSKQNSKSPKKKKK